MTDLVHVLGGRMHGIRGRCRCPAHDDTTPSLSVTDRDGHVSVYCHAGCSQADVLAALATRGLDIRQSTSSSGGDIHDYRHPTLGPPSAVWPYRDAAGRLLGYAARFTTPTGKAFRPLVRDQRRWRVRGLPHPYPLFHLPDLITRPDAPVLIVEGEKTAEAASHRWPALVVVTSIHGAKSPHKTDWSPLNHRTVTIWPDADAAGRGYADTVAHLARDAGAAAVRIVTLPDDLPTGWDLADDPPEGTDLDALMAAASAHEIGVEGEHADDAEFERTVSLLAALPSYVYDRRRKDEAIRLGVRTVTLDDAVKAVRPSTANGTDPHGRALAWPEPEPWPEPVDDAGLLHEIADFVRTYVSLSAALADTVTLWTVMTWLHDALELSTFLNITSATKRCGKSLLLDVIGSLVYRLLPTNNVTTAALFRIIEQRAPTLLLDEADRMFAKPDIPDLLATLNGSQRRESAYVLRCVGDDHEVRQFRTWCPKALVGIGDLPDTVMDRSVIIRLERRPPGANLPHWRDRDRAAVTTLQRRLARWVDDHTDAILTTRQAVTFPAGLHDRARDGWEALLAIGEVAGGDWAGTTGRAHRACAHVHANTADDGGAPEMLLADLWTIFQDAGDPEVLSTKQMLEALHALEDRPWNEWRHGKPISSRGLSNLLRLFKVTPETVRFPVGVAKGYRRDALQPAWVAYLPRPEGGGLSVTSVTSLKTQDLSASLSVTPTRDVTDRHGEKPFRINDVTDVTDRTPRMTEDRD